MGLTPAGFLQTQTTMSTMTRMTATLPPTAIPMMAVIDRGELGEGDELGEEGGGDELGVDNKTVPVGVPEIPYVDRKAEEKVVPAEFASDEAI